ncbi:MAG TPA: AAA family ATPase [Candidatus Binataceae bacterium]|nr:AAA family ATPase [Candidatus Binataceae bacterium]
MGRIIAIANQKGGVGKTTTAVNLAVALAQSGQRILLIDLDPQGNATSGLMSEPVKSRTIYDSLVGHTPLSEIIREARAQLHLAPSSTDLVGAEIELATLEGRERRLKAELEAQSPQYNYVLIDTPPSLGLLTLNALVAADAVLVPMQCEYYALEGLSSLLATIRRVNGALNPKLELMGVVLTMFDARNRLSHEISLEVQKHFPERVFESVIPRNVRISESPSHGLAVMEYDPKSVGAEAYRLLALELLERASGRAPAPAKSPALSVAVDSAAPATPVRAGEAQANGAPARRGLWNLRSIFARSAERARRNDG